MLVFQFLDFSLFAGAGLFHHQGGVRHDDGVCE